MIRIGAFIVFFLIYCIGKCRRSSHSQEANQQLFLEYEQKNLRQIRFRLLSLQTGWLIPSVTEVGVSSRSGESLIPVPIRGHESYYEGLLPGEVQQLEITLRTGIDAGTFGSNSQ